MIISTDKIDCSAYEIDQVEPVMIVKATQQYFSGTKLAPLIVRQKPNGRFAILDKHVSFIVALGLQLREIEVELSNG